MSQTLKPLLAPFRIGVDIGGTFTDLVMVDAKGQLRNEKVLTTPQDPSVGVLTGIKLILENNEVPKRRSRMAGLVGYVPW